MKRSSRRLFKIFCLLIGFCIVCSSAYAEIEVVQLDFPGAQSTGAWDINNNNVIVGSYSEDGPWADKSIFTYSVETGYVAIDTHLDDFGIITEAHVGWAINDSGTIVGGYRASEIFPRFGGFVYKEGETFLFNHPAEGVWYTDLAGINNAGKIVGIYAATNPEGEVDHMRHGFLYDGGLPVDPTRFTDINYEGENLRQTFAASINDNDIVIGHVDYYTDDTGHILYSFIYDANTGVYSPLIRFSETASQTLFSDINNLGIIAGFAELETGEVVPFLYDMATGEFTTDLGGHGMNDAGHLVAGGSIDGGVTHHGYWIIPDSTPCEEDDSGAIDIMGQAACASDTETIRVPIRIQNAYKPDPRNAVDAFGFEVTYDPAVLTFVEFERGDLLLGFDDVVEVIDVDHNEVETGVVRIGGFTTVNKIRANQEGILGYLVFYSNQAVSTKLDIQNMVDDIAHWPASGACLTPATGDINLDGEVTPADALCAFEKAIDICATTCGPCETTPCDVDQDCQCSASDSLCMFNKYLGIPSCLDI